MTQAVVSSKEDVRSKPRLVSGILSRAATLPLTVLCTMLTASLTVHAVGPEFYGQVALVATLAALLPFADLGLGAAVVNAVGEAEDYVHDEHVRRTLYTSMRLLCLSGLTLTTAAAVVSALGLWPRILGVDEGSSFNIATFVALAFFGLSLPVGMGGRLLQATGRNHIAVLLMGAVPLVALLVTFLFAAVEVQAAWFSVVPSLSLFSVSLTAFVLASRMCQVPMLAVVRQALLVGKWPGVKVFHVAGPMMIIMVGLPVALQSDRLVISHLSSTDALTQYAVGAQLYASMWGILAAGGQSLWPTLTYKRARSDAITKTWLQAFWGLLGLAGAMAASYVLLGQFVTNIITDGEVIFGPLVLVSFAALLLAQAAQLPCGMLLTKPRELAFQAKCIICMLLLSLPLSILLAPSMGAAGPVIASAFAVASCQLIPGLRAVRKTLKNDPVV